MVFLSPSIQHASSPILGKILESSEPKAQDMVHTSVACSGKVQHIVCRGLIRVRIPSALKCSYFHFQTLCRASFRFAAASSQVILIRRQNEKGERVSV